MCGITGFITSENTDDMMVMSIKKMTDSLYHRGPDGHGIWLDKEKGIALGHQRLSIIDLSPTGHQPMQSHSNRYVLTYNGEIYNFHELRKELIQHGCSFKGTSDTEVILAAVEIWGITEAVKRFVGMFAFALWDQIDNKLHLCRDRMGEKPLYYGWVKKDFLFGSELKSLLVYPRFERELDPKSVYLFLKNNYIPAPYSIYKNIYKLIPGTLLTLEWGQKQKKDLQYYTYWSLNQAIERGSKYPIQSYEETVSVLEKKLEEAVRNQMISDVPLGAFLSGGIDSSVIVSLMQANSIKPVKTFTVGFNEKNYNEAKYASAIAKRLGTSHTELYVNSQDALSIIPRIPIIYDEPFADPSQIPTYLISALTRRHVKVCLSGDGGDELFCGYDRYFFLKSIWDKTGFSYKMRNILSWVITLVPLDIWQTLSPLFRSVFLGKEQKHIGDKLYKLAEVLMANNPDELYQRLITNWKEPHSILKNSNIIEKDDYLCHFPKLPHYIQRAMYVDTLMYLPDDILVKVDRASMAASLETRVPFLDHRVVEFAWRVPLSMKIKNGKGKWIVRQILSKYIPNELIERPKSGFSVPIAEWLRGPLREWAEDLLDPVSIRSQGIFNPEPIQVKLQEHISGKRNWHYQLWNILMFQSWFREYKK